MKMIITGATGSLGAYLTRWFSGKGHEVLALGRTENPPQKLYEYATYIRADIRTPFSLPNADVCIHTAAIADDRAKPSDLYQANVAGTKNVVDASRDCKTFVHVSTSSVYVSSSRPLTEEMAGEKDGKKLSDYGKSKLIAEGILQQNCKNDSCFVLRPRGIYGPGDKVLLPRLLKLVRNKKMITAGDMNIKLSMTHFTNFALAIECCLESSKKGLNIYNVADDKYYSLSDVARKLLSGIYSYELPVRKIPLWMLQLLATLKIGEITPLFLNTVSNDFILDISKIKQELNYAPLLNFDSSLKAIIEWVETIGGPDILKKADSRLAWEG